MKSFLEGILPWLKTSMPTSGCKRVLINSYGGVKEYEVVELTPKHVKVKSISNKYDPNTYWFPRSFVVEYLYENSPESTDGK